MLNQPSIDAQKVCNAAMLFSRTVSTLIELEAMKAANAERQEQGLSQAYGEEAFVELLARSGIGENSATALLQLGLG